MAVRFLNRLLLSTLAVCSVSLPASAQTPPPDKDKDKTSAPTEVMDVVVTGSRIRQGGAQDINHFRGEAGALRVPMPDTLTPEGLMGDYDLVIGTDQPCRATFCLAGEAMKADLMLRPDDKVFVGLGFTSDIDAKTWKRQPLNLVAVVDKSGSMSGHPMDMVRKSLKQVVGQLGPDDQISIVLYGDRSHVFLEPTRITAANRASVLKSIDAISIAGSTNMEEGLRVGYDTAFASAANFKGVTRLMLFTDEQPNVGATDADTFMGMAEDASKRHIGLTTIGVGVQYDAPLATRIGSVRGGNLFFLRDDKDVKSVFSAKLDTMVSEVAWDVKMTLTPHPGYRITGVYGVPGELMGAQGENTVTVTVPTAFFSTTGGGIFVGLARTSDQAYLPETPLAAGSPLMEVGLTYVSALDGKAASDHMTVAAPDGRPSANLKLGQSLVDEFLLLKQGTTQFHASSEREGAYQTFRQLSARLDRNPDPRLKPEREMLRGLTEQTAFLSGHGSEAPRDARFVGLYGAWELTSIQGRASLRSDPMQLKAGDRFELGPDGQLKVTRAGQELGEYEFKANNEQLAVSEGGVFHFELDGPTLTLANEDNGMQLALKRATTPAPAP